MAMIGFPFTASVTYPPTKDEDKPENYLYRPVLEAISAVCKLPESEEKKEMMRELATLLAYLNHPPVVISCE